MTRSRLSTTEKFGYRPVLRTIGSPGFATEAETILRPLAKEAVDSVERQFAVLGGIASAQEVEVGAVQDADSQGTLLPAATEPLAESRSRPVALGVLR